MTNEIDLHASNFTNKASDFMSGVREGCMAGFVCFLGGVLVLTNLPIANSPLLLGFLFCVLTAASCALGYLVYRMFFRRDDLRKVSDLQAYREQMDAEALRQIEVARRRGDFDKWIRAQ